MDSNWCCWTISKWSDSLMISLCAPKLWRNFGPRSGNPNIDHAGKEVSRQRAASGRKLGNKWLSLWIIISVRKYWRYLLGLSYRCTFKAEGVEFVRYGCLLNDFGKGTGGFVVSIITLGARWCVNVINNAFDSGLNGYGGDVLAGVDMSPRCDPLFPTLSYMLATNWWISIYQVVL